MLIGSSIYSLLISKGFKTGETLRMSVIIIGISLTICAIFAGPDRDTNSITIIYFAFVMFEVAIGMYFPGKCNCSSNYYNPYLFYLRIIPRT